ncbi:MULTISPECIES: ribonuclease P protein component [Protofrankia]|uniref:Ribonuclease P protein component n=1 Tax=Candidatus Protofrankia datiscae TaxID=2716812 RepID=F8B071_9ACTN|nr:MULTISPECIES: ribonuclease P protein component [Protofrankia]AEH07597.1 Ribonuclease P protein component [Candidatus Protofrankia datiscae]
MLPVRNRVRTRAEHASISGAGRRGRSGPLVIHSLIVDNHAVDGGPEPVVTLPPRVGFVVGRKVGNAVVRNRVRRRLREQVRARLDRLPAGTLVIVRALPESATASSDELGRALERGLRGRLVPATPGTAGAGMAGTVTRPTGTTGTAGTADRQSR